MDLNTEVDQLIKASQAWIPMIMEYGSRVLLALVTLAVGWWLINRLTTKIGQLLAMRKADLADGPARIGMGRIAGYQQSGERGVCGVDAQ